VAAGGRPAGVQRPASAAGGRQRAKKQNTATRSGTTIRVATIKPFDTMHDSTLARTPLKPLRRVSGLWFHTHPFFQVLCTETFKEFVPFVRVILLFLGCLRGSCKKQKLFCFWFIGDKPGSKTTVAKGRRGSP